MRFDCGPVRVATRAELEIYMRGSAGAVGLIMAPLLGVPSELHHTVAKLGTAFQLTNFIRDVSEDYGLDRVYLPVEDRARLGVTVQDIAARRMTDGLRALFRIRVPPWQLGAVAIAALSTTARRGRESSGIRARR
jgi:phytoene synthase